MIKVQINPILSPGLTAEYIQLQCALLKRQDGISRYKKKHTLAPGSPGSPGRPGSPLAPLGPLAPEDPRSPGAP